MQAMVLRESRPSNSRARTGVPQSTVTDHFTFGQRCNILCYPEWFEPLRIRYSSCIREYRHTYLFSGRPLTARSSHLAKFDQEAHRPLLLFLICHSLFYIQSPYPFIPIIYQTFLIHAILILATVLNPLVQINYQTFLIHSILILATELNPLAQIIYQKSPIYSTLI